MRLSSKLGLVGGIAAVSVLAGVMPAAAAKPVENGHFQESESEEFDDFCGDMSVLAEHEASGHFIGKAQGEDGLIHFSANVRGTDRFTNLATDKTFTIEFAFNDKDQSVTDNGDGTLTILFKSTGIQKAFGPDGEWLFLDAGAGWAEVLIDHGGTPSDPSDDEFISADLVKASGRFDTAGRDICEDFRAITS